MKQLGVFLTLSRLLTGLVVGQEADIRAKIRELTEVIEPDARSLSELRNLPPSSLPLIAGIVEQSEHPYEYSQAIAMLIAKCEQFRGQLSAEEMAHYSKIIIDKYKKMDAGTLASQTPRLASLHRPEALAYAKTLLNHSDAYVRGAARHAVVSLEKSVKAPK